MPEGMRDACDGTVICTVRKTDRVIMVGRDLVEALKRRFKGGDTPRRARIGKRGDG